MVPKMTIKVNRLMMKMMKLMKMKVKPLYTYIIVEHSYTFQVRGEFNFPCNPEDIQTDLYNLLYLI